MTTLSCFRESHGCLRQGGASVSGGFLLDPPTQEVPGEDGQGGGLAGVLASAVGLVT